MSEPRGVAQFVSPDRMIRMRAEFDRRYATALRHGTHLWVATVAFYVQPPIQDGTHLDVENLASEPAVGCYVCEEVYTDQLAARRCAGEP